MNTFLKVTFALKYIHTNTKPLPFPSPCQAELRATLVQSPLPHSGTQPFLRLPLTLLCMLPCHILQLVTFKCSWLITYGLHTTAG